MSESFYEFIVKELLFDYFAKKNIKKGSRFCINIENSEHCYRFLQCLEKHCEPITISGIFNTNKSNLIEKEYKTFVLRPNKNKPGLIIGFDKYGNQNIKEDYLATLRNAVVAGSKYEEYCVMLVLSNSSLSSLITATKDIQSMGYPLNAIYVKEKIKNKANGIFDEIRFLYFNKYLEKISSYIDDRTCDIFAFEPALQMISEKKLDGHFKELEIFNDEAFCNRIFKNNDEEDLEKRVLDNSETYKKINDIMETRDHIDESEYSKLENKLQKIVDEKLVSKILNNPEDWQKISYEEIKKSQRIKQETETFELLDIILPNNSTAFSIKREYGNRKKKTNNYIVFCDDGIITSQEVILKFNKSIRDYIVNADSDYKLIGQNSIKLFIEKPYNFFKIGSGDNHHDFYVSRFPKSKTFFESINYDFEIKKTEIQIKFLEDMEILEFGCGNDIINDVIDGMDICWSDNKKLRLNSTAFGDHNKITLNVDFSGIKQKVAIVLDSDSIPLLGPETFPIDKLYSWIETPNGFFEKVTDGYVERGVRKYWRKYLEWEKTFVNYGCTALCCNRDSYCDGCKLCDEQQENKKCLSFADLPTNILENYSSICDYYRRKKTIPSLCPIDEELKNLYVSYCKSVTDCICNIPNNRELSDEELNLTRLGVVEQDGKVYLSPFHPMIAAFSLELFEQFDLVENGKIARHLLSPFYLIPYMFYSNDSLNPNRALRPYSDCYLSNIKNWVCYEENSNKPQERMNNITAEVVENRLTEFLKNFDYLFQDKDCPIRINTIGLIDDAYVIRGLVEYIKANYSNGIQKIELHEYVENIMQETYFEKLNKAPSNVEKIRMLKDLQIKLSKSDKYDEQIILNVLFTKVSFYKHSLISENDIQYCHIAFYQMEPQATFVPRASKKNRTELSMNGLISIPSTCNDRDAYYMGFGSKDINFSKGFIYPMALAMNSLYANEPNGLETDYRPNLCVAKKYRFDASNLLNTIYDRSNWVTFINPEVDIDYFYNKNSNVYIVHYTDQYTINAKYDSITVTKHIDLYQSMLAKTYDVSLMPVECAETFNSTMLKYFNCLNGNWLLETVKKSKDTIREKMSIVATTIAMLRFMKRNLNIVWIPISLEEILRVSKSIGLPKEYIFSQATLEITGNMSDDLLMMGLGMSENQHLIMYLYPIEIKVSDLSSRNNPNTSKGKTQIIATLKELNKHLLGEPNFTKNIYRTFFATQFLSNAEKLFANSLLTKDNYDFIEKNRFSLLNLEYELENNMPIKEMGHGAIVTFYNEDIYKLKEVVIDDTNICEIHFEEEDCFRFVANTNNDLLRFLDNEEITSFDATKSPNYYPDNNLVRKLDCYSSDNKTNEDDDVKGDTVTNQINLNKEKDVNTLFINGLDITSLARSFIHACSLRCINIENIDYKRTKIGPSVIRIPFKLKNGQSLDALTSKLDDIGREMGYTQPIPAVTQKPNSNELNLDISRHDRESVYFKDVISKIPSGKSIEEMWFPIGITPEGEDIIKNLSEMPHLLIGGSTGSGKTVFIHCLLSAILLSHKGINDIKLLLSTAAGEDFTPLEGLSQLIGGKIFIDAEETVDAILNIVAKEFDERASILSAAKVPNIIEYNRISENKLPPVLVIIDEFAEIADQLSKAKKEQFYITVRRIAQIGRKRGIHLVLCTQRPSANLVPTDIKAQLNGRIGLHVNDSNSSRMILDEMGAEHLLAHGDMYFKYNNETTRAQGYYITLDELDSIIEEVKNNK